MFTLYPDYPSFNTQEMWEPTTQLGDDTFFNNMGYDAIQESTLSADMTAKVVDPFDNTDESMMWYGMPSSAPTVDEYLI